MRALAVVRSLPEHSLIDRLVRGRAWIPVLGVLLAGIVAMQVEVLKLGTTMGKLVQRTTVLQSQNESLQASDAALGDYQRIERLAAGMGMVMPAPTTIRFLRAASGADPYRALANIHAPDPAGFAGQLAAQAAAAAAATAPQPATSSSSTPAATATTSNAATVAGPPAATTSTPATSAAPSQPATTSSAAAGQSPGTGAAAMAPAGPSQSSSPSGG